MVRFYPTRRASWPVVAIVALAIAPVLYVLSMGPAWAMVTRGQLGPDVYWDAYQPLIRLTMKSDTINRSAVRYMDWCDAHWPGEPLPSVEP